MNSRKVFIGQNTEDKPILVALELSTENKQITIKTFPKEDITDEFVDAMTNNWEKGKEVEFPIEPTVILRPAEEETILPDEIKTEKPEMLRRLKNEWTLKLLSVRLYEDFHDRITNMKSTADKAEGYTQDMWDGAKTMWNQITDHAKDFNLTRKHTGELRDNLNGVFESLKSQREKGQVEYEKTSKVVLEKYQTALTDIKEKINSNTQLNNLFEKLKSLQKEIKDAKLTHKDRRGLWKDLDEAFNKVKSEKQTIWKSHLGNRINGLRNAIEKMQSSLDRDRESLDYQKRNMDKKSVSQIEHQLRSTKIIVIQDRIKSKEEKLHEMADTLNTLKKKEESQKKKDLEVAAEKAAEKVAAKAAEAAAALTAAAQSGTDKMLDEADTPVKKAEAKEEQKAEPVVETKAETKAEPLVETKAETQTESKTESSSEKPEKPTESKPTEQKPEIKPELKSELKEEPKAETPKVKPEADSSAKSDS